MENDKLDNTPATAIVPSGETSAELIPQPTAELIEKSFAENTVRNRRQALQHFDEWLQERQVTDGLLRISEVIELRIDDLETTRFGSGSLKPIKRAKVSICTCARTPEKQSLDGWNGRG